MKRPTLLLPLLSFALLGMSMPSCPGQQEMKDQILALQNQNEALTKRLAALEEKVTPLLDDMDKVKQLLQPISDTVQTQKLAMDQLDAAIKELQTKIPAPKGAKKK